MEGVVRTTNEDEADVWPMRKGNNLLLITQRLSCPEFNIIDFRSQSATIAKELLYF